MPPFRGELGKNVGTVLWLKIWRTLELPPQKGAPSAGMWYQDEPYEEDESFQDIEDNVRNEAIRIVLWGNTIKFGDGVLAQPLLCILPDKDQKAGGEDPLTWEVLIPAGESFLRLDVTIPQTRYQLPPILLNNSLLRLYTDVPSVKVYKGRHDGPSLQSLGHPIAELGRNFTAQRTEGDFTQVLYDGGIGWIYLPQLEGDITVVDYIAGVIRLLRWDCKAAIEKLKKSAASGEDLPLKIDSLLLQAIATAKLKEGNPGPIIESAELLDPYLQTTAKFKILYLISRIKAGAAKDKQATIAALEGEIAAKDYLFPPGDQWLYTAKKILATVQR